MAKFDYDRMQKTATRLLDRFSQGVVQLKRETPGVVDPDQPWVPVEPTVALYPLNAAVKRVDQRYENGVLIVQTGDMVTFAVPEVVPLLTDFLIIDGTERVITSLRPTPAAGTVVKWTAFCAT
ncbi:hypothetical protein FJ981_28045 [Mesorhizobium sp. B1-1-4]|uniref:hypothetical protein n=1 Tax=Mesorhizobium sp. B1-1-4 TaxID=2589980 RepID=UPI0011290E19|nr:hypothetical protein [Mesorhizobium sp. B1-1-4]TPN44450.1 hypothetical protein FJ981_28045 [Mesorhizobium sp. B1-1-4]